MSYTDYYPGQYQTKNLFSPITQRVISINSPAFKSLTRDTTFKYDKKKNILVPDNKTNYIFNNYLGRWFHKDYKLKKDHKPPTAKDVDKLNKAKATYSRISEELRRDEVRAKAKAKAPPATKHNDYSFLDDPELLKELNADRNAKIAKMRDLKRGEFMGDSKPTTTNNLPEPVKFTKVKPERANMSYTFTTLPERFGTRLTRVTKKYDNLDFEKPGIDNLTNRKYYRIIIEINTSNAYKQILKILEENNNRLYWDNNNTKKIKYTYNTDHFYIDHKKVNKLLKVFLLLKNDSDSYLNNYQAYYSIFNTLKFDKDLIKKVEPKSSAAKFIKYYDEILNKYGREPFPKNINTNTNRAKSFKPPTNPNYTA
jgi:hypothetical protein